MTKGSPIFISLILLSIIQCLNSLPEEPHDSMRLELIHRHAPQRNARPKTQLESIKELLHIDIIRLKMISHKLGLSQKPRRQAWEMSTSNNDAILPLYSGNEYNLPGLYFATFKVGTPSQTFEVIVDTASDLTWLNCRYQSKDHNSSECLDANCKNHWRVFLADFSSSFKPIPYDSRICKIDFKEHHAGSYDGVDYETPTHCLFQISYGDGSTAEGFLAKEILTLPLSNGGEAKLDAVIGCSTSFEGGHGNEITDGLIGLAYSNFSFVPKLNERFGGKFSYCLVDHWSPKNVSNHLTLGANYNKQSLLKNMSYTKLQYRDALYTVNVRGISIDGVMLNIPSETWMSKYGGTTIIDSGSTASVLREPAYSIVTNTLMKSLSNFKRITVKGVPLKSCFIATGFEESMVPKLAYHFDDGAIFEPHVKGYVTDIEEKQGVRCIGFALGESGFDINIIGNRMQQNYLWEFDIQGQKLGFAPSTCT